MGCNWYSHSLQIMDTIGEYWKQDHLGTKMVFRVPEQKQNNKIRHSMSNHLINILDFTLLF